ncbi:MAG: hypothetical protein WD717_07175 [Nitrosarchaeum sp.]
MLSNTFLQTGNFTDKTVNFFGLDSESTLSLFTFVLALATIGLVIVTGLSLRKSKMEKLTYESQFIGGILYEFTICDEKERNAKTSDDCLHCSFAYLNILDKLCFFDSKNYLSNDIMEFFKNYLKSGLGYYNWLKDIGLSQSDLEESYPSVMKSCRKRNIVPPTLLGQLFEEHREKIKKKKESNSA